MTPSEAEAREPNICPKCGCRLWLHDPEDESCPPTDLAVTDATLPPQDSSGDARRLLQQAFDAIETGRSEPLYIIRDAIRNWLEDNPEALAASSPPSRSAPDGYVPATDFAAAVRSGLECVGTLRGGLSEIESIARQAEVYHERLGGASKVFGDIAEKARAIAAAPPTPSSTVDEGVVERVHEKLVSELRGSEPYCSRETIRRVLDALSAPFSTLTRDEGVQDALRDCRIALEEARRQASFWFQRYNAVSTPSPTLTPDADDGSLEALIDEEDVISIINVVTDLHEADALDKAFPEILARMVKVVRSFAPAIRDQAFEEAARTVEAYVEFGKWTDPATVQRNLAVAIRALKRHSSEGRHS